MTQLFVIGNEKHIVIRVLPQYFDSLSANSITVMGLILLMITGAKTQANFYCKTFMVSKYIVQPENFTKSSPMKNHFILFILHIYFDM